MKEIKTYKKLDYEMLVMTGAVYEIPLLELIDGKEMTGSDIRQIMREEETTHIINLIVNTNPLLETEMVHYGLKPYAIIENGMTYLLMKDKKSKYIKYSINDPQSERLEKFIRIKVQKYLDTRIQNLIDSGLINDSFRVHTEMIEIMRLFVKNNTTFKEIVKHEFDFYELELKDKEIKVQFKLTYVKEPSKYIVNPEFTQPYFMLNAMAYGADVTQEMKNKIQGEFRTKKFNYFDKFKISPIIEEVAKKAENLMAEVYKDYFKEKERKKKLEWQKFFAEQNRRNSKD